MRFLIYPLVVCIVCTGICRGQTGDADWTLPELFVTAGDKSLHTSAARAGLLMPVDPVDLPLAVEIVPQELIDARNIYTFYETLDQVSGVFSGGRSSFTRSSGKPSIRGFSGSDVMLDGLVLPARMPMFMDAEGISAVEFYKGPISSVQGGQSGLQGSGGSINIRGKMPSGSASFQRLSLSGLFGNGSSIRMTYDPDMRLMTGLGLRVPLAANYDEPFYLPSDVDGGENFFTAPALQWNVAPDTEIMLSGTYQYCDQPAYQGIPYLKGDFLVPLDTYYGNDDTRDVYKGLTLFGRASHRFTDDLGLHLGGGYARADEHRRHWSVSPGAPRGSGMTVEQYYDRVIETHTAVYSYTDGKHLDENRAAFAHLDYTMMIGTATNQWIAGVDWLERKTDHETKSGSTGWQRLDHPTLDTPTLSSGIGDGDSRVDRTGWLLQDFISVNRWRILAGARMERHKSDEGNQATSWSPRLGITCLVQPDFAIYGNYTIAEGPNFGYTDRDGEELTDSWKAEQLEAGIKKRFFENLWISVNGFQIRRKNTPEVDPLDPSGTSYITDGENRSRGCELSLNGEINDDWNWWGSYTYLEYEDVDADIDFARYPRNSLTLWTAYRLPSTFLKGLRASIGYRYVSKRYTTFRGQYISDQYTIDPYHVVDLAFEYPLKFFSGQTMETRLEFGIKNIFDEEYVESNRHGTENFPGQPRVCWSRLSAAF